MSDDGALRAILEAWRGEGRRRAAAAARLEGPRLAFETDAGGDTDMPAASVAKLPLVMALYGASGGRPSSRYPGAAVGDLPRSAMPQVSQGLPPDLVLPPEALAALAVMPSDNPAAEWLFRAVGKAAVRAELDAAGCSPTTRVGVGFSDEAVKGPQVDENRITANDARRLLRRALSDDRFADLRERVLPNCVLNARIPGDLGDRYVVGHKTGTLTPHGVANDAGYVRLGEQTLILVFLTHEEADVGAAGRSIAAAAERAVAAVENR